MKPKPTSLLQPLHILGKGVVLCKSNNAARQKVKKVANLGTTNNVSGTSLTDYLGGYQYNNDVLQFFPHAQGYVKHTVNPSNGASEFDYVYQYKDHLGNIRINYTFDTATSSLRVLEENHYYPFGLKHQENLQPRSIRFAPSTIISNEWVKGVGYAEPPPPMAALVPNSGYQYKYQEQERQDELGLNWDSFKWRNYDYAIGRFMSIDPLSEKYVHNGVYNFSENRVIDAWELEGLEAVLIVDAGNYLKADVGHTFVSTGTGKNTTVYTYGRWAGTNENSSGKNTPLNNGPGVMVKLTGNDAIKEIEKYIKNGAQAFEIKNTSESLVNSVLENEFIQSSKTPDSGKYKGDGRAHVIDDYYLTSNNCTTKSLDAITKGKGDDIKYTTTTTTVDGYSLTTQESTSGTYTPSELSLQLNQAVKDKSSGVVDITKEYKK